jgi:hypothetical protein
MAELKQPKLYALLQKWLAEAPDDTDPDLDTQILELERDPNSAKVRMVLDDIRRWQQRRTAAVTSCAARPEASAR